MNKHPVPIKLLTQIGEMTVSFAMLESNIQALLGSLIQEHQRIGQILAAQLSFKMLRATVSSLYRERHGEDNDFKTLKNLLRNAGKIEQERNKIIHSIWGAGKTVDTIKRLKITSREKHGFQFQSEDYDEKKFIVFNKKIKKLTLNFITLSIALIDNGKAINNPIDKLW